MFEELCAKQQFFAQDKNSVLSSKFQCAKYKAFRIKDLAIPAQFRLVKAAATKNVRLRKTLAAAEYPKT